MSAKSALVLLRAHLDKSALDGEQRVVLHDDARAALHHLATDPPAKRSIAVPTRQFEQPAPLPPSVESRPLVTPPPADILQVAGQSLEEKLGNLAAMAETDTKARALGTLRDTMVFAVGDPHASLMFIGEAPGSEEERQREPFVGPAGQLLSKIIQTMGLARSSVYLTNLCKFRPDMGEGQSTRDRPPTPAEMAVCLPYVLTEIDLIRPQVIVALGAPAATGLGIEGTVGRLRGQWQSLGGTPVMVTYHPSYLLRQEQEGQGMAAKRLVWEDMLMVMERLGLAISEKQRGFFKAK